MAKNKVYAVRKGLKTGKFYSWAECESVIKGFSGAVYKGFATEEEADAYLSGDDSVVKPKYEKVVIPKPINSNECNVYVDGTLKEGRVGYGVYIEGCNGSYALFGKVENIDSANNITGEIVAMMVGVQLATKLGFVKIQVIYDCEACGYFVNGVWQPTSEFRSKFVGYMRIYNVNPNYMISYKWVKGHNGCEGNKKADILAKRGVNFASSNINLDRLFGNCLEREQDYYSFGGML